MKINEVENFYANLTHDALVQLVESKNTTGIRNDILVRIIEQANDPTCWQLDEGKGKEKKKKKQQQASAPEVPVPVDTSVFRHCPLYYETYAEKTKSDTNEEIIRSVEGFKKTKSGNPIAPYGKKDTPFVHDGNLKYAVAGEVLRHSHILYDLNLVYSLQGKHPCDFKLYGLFTHDELGIGQPPSIPRQKSMAKQFAHQSTIFEPGPEPKPAPKTNP